MTFSLDCYDRDAIAWRAQSAHFCSQDIQGLMAMTIEARFDPRRTAHPVEWLSDNGPPYTTDATRAFGGIPGLLVRNTPSCSSVSSGMAEAFVKTLKRKRDYVYLADFSDAETVLRELAGHDYNANASQTGLKMRSPRQFRRAQSD